jgi:hypothetical protein
MPDVRGRHSKLSGSSSSRRQGRHLSHRAARHERRRVMGTGRPSREALHLRSCAICWASARQSVLLAVTPFSRVPSRPPWRPFWSRVGASTSRPPGPNACAKQQCGGLGFPATRLAPVLTCSRAAAVPLSSGSSTSAHRSSRSRAGGSAAFRSVPKCVGAHQRPLGICNGGTTTRLAGRHSGSQQGTSPHAGSGPMPSARSISQYHLHPAPSNPGMQRTRFARR